MRFTTKLIAGETGPAGRDLFILIVFLGASFFLLLWRIPLLGSLEGIPAEVALEMLQTGDPIIPRLNSLMYFENPPLHFWLISLSLGLLGQNEFAVRFPGALLGFLGVLWTYHLGRRLHGRRAGFLSALFLGTSLGYVVQARIGTPDTALAVFLSGALGSFLLASRENASSRGIYYHLLYLFSALALLARGLEGIVLPLGAIALYLLLKRRGTLLREMRIPTGLVLFLLVGAPWFILVEVQNPGFLRFFLERQVEQFLGKGPDPHQPIWFFIPTLLACLLPWSFFLPFAAADFWRRRREEGADSRFFLALWAALLLGFFSISRSGSAQDILGILPPLALLAGTTFSNLFRGEFKEIASLSHAASLASGIAGILALVHPHVAREPLFSPRGGMVMGIILLLGGILGFFSTRKRDAVRLVAVLCLIWFHLELIGMPYVLRNLVERSSSRELALLVKEVAGEDARIACWRGYDPAFSFYTGRLVLVAGERGMLEFGGAEENQNDWFLDLFQFQKIWDSGQPLFVLTADSNLDQLRDSVKIPVRILKKTGKLALVTNS